jgi:hypothetical protein
MTKPIKNTVITALFLFMAVSVTAQDSYLKNRWNIKLAGAPKFNYKHTGFLITEANYGILNNFEIGVALGLKNTRISKLKPGASNPPSYNDYYSADYIMPIYNLNLNYHLLPYLVKGNNSKFDLYLSGRLGGYYINSNAYDKPFFWNYYLGGGLAWYFTRNIGIYTEYGKQYHFNSIYTDKGFRFGIGVKF